MNQNQLIWLIFWLFVLLAAPAHPVLWIPLGVIALVFIGDWLFSLV